MNGNTNIIINIENLVYGGYGLGRLEGKVILVDFAVPGDTVNIRVYEDHKNYSIAEIDEIIKPSPRRIEPECPLFGRCGGCSFQNISYDYELQCKKEMIVDQLKRVAGLKEDEIPEIETIADKRYGYRSHTRFNTCGGEKGFFRKGSNDLIPFPEKGCLLLADELNERIKTVEAATKKSEIRIALDSEKETHVCMAGESLVIRESESGITYLRDIGGFFQANRLLRSEMQKRVVELSGLKEKDIFLDICSGCGFFTLPLAKRSGQGYGFDIDADSIRFGRENAELNGIKNVKFFNLPESEIKPHHYHTATAVVDPPRSGLSKRGRKTLNAVNAERIVYVSCNPSTFARDLKDIIKNGYRLKKLLFIDMFPCTHHIELISQIEKSDVTV